MEKIGSGNWYWSFASQDTKTRQKALDEAQLAHDKAAAVVADLRAKVDEAEALRADEEDMLESGGENREEMMTAKAVLTSDTQALQQQLAAYSDNDPTELERKRNELTSRMAETEQYTDEIYSMEAWFKSNGQEEEGMIFLRKSLYGDELDEDGVLRESD